MLRSELHHCNVQTKGFELVGALRTLPTLPHDMNKYTSRGGDQDHKYHNKQEVMSLTHAGLIHRYKMRRCVEESVICRFERTTDYQFNKLTDLC